MAYVPRTSPDQDDTGWPPGVRYIIGNEGCERFSYYGMRAILTVFLAQYLYLNHPVYSQDPERIAKAHYHVFAGAVYLFPLLGAVIADRLIGKYRAILGLSIVYCAGHGVLALSEHSVTGFWIGLGLIAVGSGGIKPNVSAHVGDQFGRSNWFRVPSIFQAFYFIINLGSAAATLLIPKTLQWYGPGVAFGIPGTLMALATLAFWMGRKVFVHVPAHPGGKLGALDALSSGAFVVAFAHLFAPAVFHDLSWKVLVPSALGFIVFGGIVFAIRQRIEQDDGFLAVLFYAVRSYLSGAKASPAEPGAAPAVIHADPKVQARRERVLGSRLFGPAARHFGVEAAEGPPAVLNIVSVFFLVSVFWALFDQHGSSWVLQAKTMNLHLPGIGDVQPSQIAALNPVMVMLLIPLNNRLIYPGIGKLGFEMTPLRRMTGGMLVAGASFLLVAFIQHRIEAAGVGQVSFLWQVLPYLVITQAEVMVSITGLEFAYTQAPKRMKSTVMGFWLAAVAGGNLMVALFETFSTLPLATGFQVYAGLMFGAGVLFGIRAYFYRSRDYVQD